MTKTNAKTNVLITSVVGAMLVAMLPVMLNMNSTVSLQSAEADDSMERPYVKVYAKTALYEPGLGKTNVFGPGGIFPFFNDTFSCADDVVKCGVLAEGATFKGVFKEAGGEDDNRFSAEYTSPITYGEHQVAGHKYRIELVDTEWNNADLELTPTPTRVPQFLTEGHGVAFDQIQHGHSMVDRADAPMFVNKVALYGHANIYDITDGAKELVVEKIFVHLMVGHVVDEGRFYSDFQFNSALPLVVALFAVNVPSGVELPGGIGPLTSEQAQGFTPLPDDPSLTNPPPADYVQLLDQGVQTEEPMPQSTVWPVDNPTQPVFFTFLLYTETKAFNSPTNTVPGFD
ncbi:MAG TPA: hypothetical protein VI338_06010 [Nitrososphaera sp.]|nr:hypothetical protein [Nitrososphaera sp.]